MHDSLFVWIKVFSHTYIHVHTNWGSTISIMHIQWVSDFSPKTNLCLDDPTHPLQHRPNHATLYTCMCVWTITSRDAEKVKTTTTTTQQKGKATQHNSPETVIFRRKLAALGGTWTHDHQLSRRCSYQLSYQGSSAYVYKYTPYTQIAGVNYGGHVTDDFDRRVLYTYIGEMFKDDVLEQPYQKYVCT